MALTTQDFDNGVDFTGVNPVTAGDLNNLVTLGSPHQESATEGKGLVITTYDTALNTPDVPQAQTTTKWQKYTWQRVPFSTASNLSPILYGWSNNTPSVITFLRWLPIQVDFTNIQNQVDNANTNATTAQTTANQAINLAQSVNTIATNANAAATQASIDATSAIAAANAASGVASVASANATTALTAANGASTAVAGVATSLADFQNKTLSCYLQETAVAGVDLAALAVGKNTRNINTVQSDVYNLVTLGAGKMTITNAGDYEIDATIPAFLQGDNSVKSFLVKDSDNSNLVIGTSAYHIRVGGATQTENWSVATHIKGRFTATAGMVVRIDTYATNVNGLLGKAVSLGGVEVYSTLILKGVI